MGVQLSNKIRIIFFLSQILYMAFGAAMFAVGIYSIVNLQRFGVFTQSTYSAGAAIFIVAGVFKVVFGLLGILVMFWQKKPLVVTFTLGVIFLMFLTFIAGIYGFIARPGAFYTTRERLTDAFRTLGDFEDNRDDIDTVQKADTSLYHDTSLFRTHLSTRTPHYSGHFFLSGHHTIQGTSKCCSLARTLCLVQKKCTFMYLTRSEIRSSLSFLFLPHTLSPLLQLSPPSTTLSPLSPLPPLFSPSLSFSLIVVETLDK